jgi:hypothetical protein
MHRIETVPNSEPAEIVAIALTDAWKPSYHHDAVAGGRKLVDAL